jgi:ribosome-associated translation inhibitor RaiA
VLVLGQEVVGMNIDVQTEQVRMQPEWRRMIDDWVQRCRRQHPEVADVEVTLRHREEDRLGETVTIDATARRRHMYGTGRATMMSLALHDALDAVERELLVHEAVTRRM